jgi:hypothetical protein
MAIASLDDGAVEAASRDPRALIFGGAFWIVGQLLYLIGALFTVGANPVKLNWLALLPNVGFLIVMGFLAVLAQWGICHMLAGFWFEARGTYAGVLRPLLLGSVVLWFGVIPFIGSIIAGLWSIAVMMIVFEDVDGIGRLRAFLLSAVVGIFFQGLMRSYLALR